MGGAGIKARGAPPDERQQPRHRADEAGPSGASGCASRVASSALVAKNRDRPIGRTNMDTCILKGPEADCGARALPPRAAFSKVARERGISSGRRRGLAPAVDPRDTTSASPVSPNPLVTSSTVVVAFGVESIWTRLGEPRARRPGMTPPTARDPPHRPPTRSRSAARPTAPNGPRVHPVERPPPPHRQRTAPHR